jgi:hypothetical protein
VQTSGIDTLLFLKFSFCTIENENGSEMTNGVFDPNAYIPGDHRDCSHDKSPLRIPVSVSVAPSILFRPENTVNAYLRRVESERPRRCHGDPVKKELLEIQVARIRR